MVILSSAMDWVLQAVEANMAAIQRRHEQAEGAISYEKTRRARAEAMGFEVSYFYAQI